MRRLVLLAALAFAAPALRAQSFEGLGSFSRFQLSIAYGVSADGAFAVGAADSDLPSPSNFVAVRWRGPGLLDSLGFLPGTDNSFAYGVSADGDVVVGESRAPSSGGFPFPTAFRWTPGGGMASLGSLGGTVSIARAVSADGAVTVGHASRADGRSAAFRWTAGGGMEDLGYLQGHADNSPYAQAHGISPDGLAIVGATNGADFGESQAFRWMGGAMEGLGSLWGEGFGNCVATAASNDGAAVVGWSHSNSTGVRKVEAFRWAGGSMQGLGYLNGQDTHATAVSGDGTVVVGRTTPPGGTGAEAFIWTAEGGMRALKDVLEDDYGLDLTGWSLLAAYGISDDGRVIVGFGMPPAEVGQSAQAWRAVLSPTGLVVNDTGDEENDPVSTAEQRCDVDRSEEGHQCTLRAAIEVALADDGEDAVTIGFNIEGEGPHVLALGSALPTVDRPVELDGTTEPDYVPGSEAAQAVVSVFVVGGGAVARGLVLATDSSVVRGLGFGGFTEAAVEVTAGAGPHRVEGSWFGLDPSGTAAMPNGVGLRVNGAAGVVIGSEADSLRNVIAGNTTAGVQVVGAGSTDVRVVGNWIGVTPSGEGALPDAIGVDVLGVPGLRVEGNTIVASAAGVRLSGTAGAPTTDAVVEGNRLGLLPDNALPPGPQSAGYGVLVEAAARTRVGGAADAPGGAPGNVIGGWNAGVFVVGTASGHPVGTVIAGNLVGLDSTGTAARPNGVGVWVHGGTEDTRVGGWAPGERNVISGGVSPTGNGSGVVVTAGDGTVAVGEPTGVVVAGNYIGTDVTGMEEIGHQKWGVYVGPFPSGGAGGPSDVVIGATAEMAGGAPADLRRNVILGSGEANVYLDRAGAAPATPVRVVGNWIGLDAAGAGGIDQSTFGGATHVGVHVTGTARATVGGPGEDGNVVGSHRIGVWMDADDGVVVGNTIGTDPAGTERRANSHGVAVSGSRVRVGLAADGAPVPNLISGNILAGTSNGANDGIGVYVASRDFVEPIVTGGTAAHDEAGALAFGPTRATATRTEATRSGAAPAVDNVVAFNLVGTTAAGDAAVVPTPDVNRTAAVWVTSGAVGTQVYANTLSGTYAGIVVAPPSNVTVTTFPTGTRVAGNRIGLTAAGGDDAFVPNRVYGLFVSGATDTVVGDEAVAGQGPNRIAGTGTEGSGLPPADFAPGVALAHPDDLPEGWPIAGPTLRRNWIYGNEGLAITRDEHFGVTPNSGDNTDGVASFNVPQFYKAVDDGATLTVTGGSSVPMAVEVYADRPCDALGHGEGRLYLGTLQSADGVFSGTVDRVPFSDWRVSVTGTNANGTTSEFGACRAVSAPGETAEAEVGPGQTPTVDGPDLTVAVTANPALAAKGTASAEGTLFLALHQGTADDGAFAGTATGADGTPVAPNGVQRQRFWSLAAAGLDGLTYTACLRYDNLASLPVPGQLVVVTRPDRGTAWTPHASTLASAGGESALCAAGLTAFGELAIGADSTVNPVASEPGAEPQAALPTAFALSAWPNPARGAATVAVLVPEAQHVRVEVFDLLGRRVAVLHDGALAAGEHTLRLDTGSLPGGVYVVRAAGATATRAQRITVLP